MKAKFSSSEGGAGQGQQNGNKHRRCFPLWQRVLAGAFIGTWLGLMFGSEPFVFGFGNGDLGEIGMLVIRLLKTLAIPLVLFAILDALVKTRISARRAGHLILICAANAIVALLIALTLLNVLKPGLEWQGKLTSMVEGLRVEPEAKAGTVAVKPSLGLVENLKGYVPTNMVDPLRENNLITIVFAGLLGGLALRKVKDRQDSSGANGGKILAQAIETIYACLLEVICWVIQIVPVAVLGIIAERVGSTGLQAFSALWVLMAVILLGLGIHSLVYYPAVIWLIAGMSPAKFFRGGADAVITAASGNSSLAAVPVTLTCLTEKMGISRDSARLSACVGTNLNNDGIVLYEAMAALFLAQACGLDLTVSQQAVLMLASMMAAVGVAGVPEAGLVVLPLVLAAVGLPEWVVAAALPLLLPVDWVLARARSGVNVMSDMVVAVLLDGRRHTAIRCRSSLPSAPRPVEKPQLAKGGIGHAHAEFLSRSAEMRDEPIALL